MTVENLQKCGLWQGLGTLTQEAFKIYLGWLTRLRYVRRKTMDRKSQVSLSKNRRPHFRSGKSVELFCDRQSTISKPKDPRAIERVEYPADLSRR